MLKNKKAQHGFTLVEVIIVMAIVGILSAIAYPSFSKWVPRTRLKAAARDLYSDLQKAKLTAIKENTTVGVQFSTVAYPTQGGGYRVFADDGSGGGTRGNSIQDGGESTLWSSTMVNNISLVSASFTSSTSSIAFTPSGVVAQSRAGNAQLRIADRWYRTTVSASGGLRIEISADGSDGSWN